MYQYAVSVHVSQIQCPEWREALGRSKFKRIELSYSDSPTMDELSNLITAIQSDNNMNGIEITSVHFPFFPFGKFQYKDLQICREAIDFLKSFMKTAAQLHPKHFTFHPSIEPIAPEDRTLLITNTRKVIEESAETAAELGASFNVELLPRTCIGNTPEEILALTDGIPEAGICFDVNHLTFENGAARVPEFIDRLRDRIRTFHLSDYDSIDESHWLPGIGLLNWPQVMDAIRRIQGTPQLIFETSIIKPNGITKRDITPEHHFHMLERAAFYLENCRELDLRANELTLP